MIESCFKTVQKNRFAEVTSVSVRLPRSRWCENSGARREQWSIDKGKLNTLMLPLSVGSNIWKAQTCLELDSSFSPSHLEQAKTVRTCWNARHSPFKMRNVIMYLLVFISEPILHTFFLWNFFIFLCWTATVPFQVKSHLAYIYIYFFL